MQRKRDGDGDGFVDDGTPLERPWVPGVDLGPVEDAAKAKPKVPGGQQVPADVAVKRGRVGNVDTPRLQRRRERLISEIDDPGQFYKGGRHGFAMRAAELTVIESELVKRGDLKVKDRYTVSIKDKVEVPDWENATELGSSGSGWDGRVYVVPDDTTMDTGGRPYDHWTREVPILPDHLLEWVAEGANLGGLRNRDDNRLDRMKNYARSLLEERQGGGEDDSWGPTHEAIWDRLTKGQDSRQALSRAIHDGPTPEERDFYRLLHEHFLDFAARRWPEHGDVIPVQRMSTEDDPFTSNVGWKKKAEQPKAGSSGFTSWDAMDYDEPYYHELRARRSRSGATTWVGDVPKDQILGRFGDTENELLIAKDPETLQRLIGEPDSPFATTDTPGEVGGAAAPVEMDDTFRKAVNQRGSRVNAEDMQDAWAVAVANPDDIEAIRAALPPIAIDRWQRLHGASPEESLRRGRGGMPSLEGMIAHNARRLTEAVPLTRDNLGVNGMPSSAEIVEHDPAMAKWLGITDRTSFGELRTAIARRPLANLLSDPEPDPQGIRYLKMLRRAAERDVGRRGGAVTLHRANTQGTDTPFDTKGGSGLTSWTTDYATAAKYAKGGVTVASVDVPGDRILAYDTFGIMASTGFYDFAGQDSYPLPGREVLVTSPEVIERLDAGEFPLLPPAAAGEAPAAPVVAAVDGDGDGFVYDGTPRMRPVGPQDIGAVKGGRKRKPFTERLDEGEAGSLAEPIKVLRRANIANVAERHREVVEDHYFETDGWTPYVPELDTETLHWAVYGANLIGVDGRDPDDDTSEILSMSVSAERLLRHLSYGSYANQRLGAKLNDDEYAFHMENVWLHLTQTQDARRALSRAAHDGPSEAEADFYRFVHQWFRQMSTEGTAARGDTVPVRRYFLRDWFWADTPEDAELPDDPFAPGTRWKEVGERPNAPGSGL
ncbi:MAG: hypothetical protein KTQ12_10490 [Dermatophilaceae bacterium]|nr:hypothetical protein [Dermatophilaceae bacterium]